MKKIWFILVVVISLVLIFAWGRLIKDFNPPKADLADLGSAPAFQLTDSLGQTFTHEDLKNKVWVADFIFTTCAGICPKMSKNMFSLYQSYLSDKNVHFVSISVNPTYDTPEILTAYAKRHKADPSRWHFLTGKIETIEEIMTKGFKIGSAESPAMHSGYFVLVDRSGHIRGYYDGLDRDRIKQLLSDIAVLLKEK